MPQQVFTTAEVARVCQVASSTVVGWIDSGMLKGWRVPGGTHRRVTRESLEQFMREHGMEALLSAIPEPEATT